MEKKINLIPPEMAVPPKAVKVVRIITKITTLGAISLVVIIILAISIFAYFKFEYNKIRTAVGYLKLEIINLEQREQKLVLVKDRLEKIRSIKNYPSMEKDLANYLQTLPIINNVSGLALSEVAIDPLKTQFSTTSQDSNSLAAFLEPVSKLTVFKNMVLTSLGFSQSSGFTSDIIIKAETPEIKNE